MAIRTVEEIMEAIRNRIGDDDSDEALALLEDVADTLADMSVTDGEDWKAKYDENDKAWRQRYKERFLRPVEDEEIVDNVNELEGEKTLTFEELFETKEEN